MRHVVTCIVSGDSNIAAYVLVDERGDLLDSARWLDLLDSGDIESEIFHLEKQMFDSQMLVSISYFATDKDIVIERDGAVSGSVTCRR